MKLFRLTLGITDVFGVAEDAEDMYNKRTEIDSTFAYLPVNIEEVTLPGYEIEVTPIKEESKVKTRK